MANRVAIIGVGQTPIRPTTPDFSYKELMFEAASKAYNDAGIDPRRDVESFVCSSEDFWEGTSIFDEYVPDPIGGSLKPVCTICADGLYSLIVAHMQILTGLFDVVAVEAHSKVSDIRNPFAIMELALDPVFTRPLGFNPYFVAGLEMKRYLHETGNTRQQCAEVAATNRKIALKNPLAAYGANISAEDVLNSELVSDPLTRLDISHHADGATVMVLACEEKAKGLTDRLVFIGGAGWSSDTPWLENRDWGEAPYARLSGNMAYRKAGIDKPPAQIDFAEIDDTFSYKQLQHIEELGLCRRGEAGTLLERGELSSEGRIPVNTSGGSLGMGHTLEMTGLQRVAEAVTQLRGEAGARQVQGAERALVQCWRGVPTTSGAAVVLSTS